MFHMHTVVHVIYHMVTFFFLIAIVNFLMLSIIFIVEEVTFAMAFLFPFSRRHFPIRFYGCSKTIVYILVFRNCLLMVGEGGDDNFCFHTV